MVDGIGADDTVVGGIVVGDTAVGDMMVGGIGAEVRKPVLDVLSAEGITLCII